MSNILNGIFNKPDFSPAKNITGANLILWNAANTGVTTVSDDVSEWRTLAGSNNATQTTAGSRPDYVLSEKNGRPVVRNPNTKILTYGDVAAFELDDLSIFAVVKKTTAAVQSIISLQCQAAAADSEQCGLSFRFTGINTLQLVNFYSIVNRSAVTAGTFSNAYHIVGITKSGTTCRFFNQSGDSAPGSNNLLASLNYSSAESVESALFAQPTDTSGGGEGYNGNFAGDIAEILLYDDGLSVAEGNSIVDYLKSKWAI